MRKNILWLQILPLLVLQLSLTLHPCQSAWLFLRIANIFPCGLQNGFRQNGTDPYQLLDGITYGCFPP